MDDLHRHTGRYKQIVAGEVMEAASGLAACQYEGEEKFYLFGCDARRNSITNTWHETLEGEKEQAEFEYEGVTKAWQTL